eukprot:4095714-Lingulodinium_polyedra.AAC.1
MTSPSTTPSTAILRRSFAATSKVFSRRSSRRTPLLRNTTGFFTLMNTLAVLVVAARPRHRE